VTLVYPPCPAGRDFRIRGSVPAGTLGRSAQDVSPRTCRHAGFLMTTSPATEVAGYVPGVPPARQRHAKEVTFHLKPQSHLPPTTKAGRGRPRSLWTSTTPEPDQRRRQLQTRCQEGFRPPRNRCEMKLNLLPRSFNYHRRSSELRRRSYKHIR